MVRSIAGFLTFRGSSTHFLSSRVLAVCQLLPLEYRFFAYRRWSVTSVRKQKMVCLVTGRGRGLVSHYGVSRLAFKGYAARGVYGGLKKFVW